ncbi:2Fe-2S iron-sulfur cluster binding domain-containing protein [Thalassovita sp.]|uniref:2Fe-2S iron-sulfur cluster binding domain-containing protein n=1 Tax=Thalassovita sp. TaxID=1979401 RepID=UPI0028812081|nr:2Fe-2S iron-sulfur cluster binding domain-containing protein [Thalassovita sp.]MDF1802083.1 2Fe-2S iron-sulfur cluster binding domain-containing protein [Thalassovita sp.]
MADGTERRRFSVRVNGAPSGVHCDETQKVLTALEHAFPDPDLRAVRVGCRQGGCGACRVKVIKGEYTTAKMSRAHVTEEEEAEGFALACRLYPQSDLEIEPAFLGPRGRQQKQDN